MPMDSSTGLVVLRVAEADAAGFSHPLDDLQIQFASDLVANRPLPPAVVLDLRACSRMVSNGLGRILTFHRYCASVNTTLVVLVGGPAVADTLRMMKLDKILNVCEDRSELRSKFNLDPSVLDFPAPAEEPVSFTADELREMEADGFTLSDAIRAVEADRDEP